MAATDGTWHIHKGGRSPDSKSRVYTRDQDQGDIYELVEKRQALQDRELVGE